jgi:hypothetical protein
MNDVRPVERDDEEIDDDDDNNDDDEDDSEDRQWRSHMYVLFKLAVTTLN